MGSDDGHSDSEQRVARERRSGVDTRSELEKRLTGERRSGVDRRAEGHGARTAVVQPTDAQLALFARRLRRALRNEKDRDSFGVARGENDFAVYPEVLKTLEWIESLSGSGASEDSQPAGNGEFPLRKTPSRKDI
jgi:hypothetical protein